MVRYTSKGYIAMIKIYLSRLLGERRWSQTKLSGLTGIRPSTIRDIYNEIAERVSFESLSKMCEALDCSLDELLEYIPYKKSKTGSDLIVGEHGNRYGVGE